MLTKLEMFTATLALIDARKPLDPAYSRSKHRRSWVTLCVGRNENTDRNNQILLQCFISWITFISFACLWVNKRKRVLRSNKFQKRRGVSFLSVQPAT